MFLVTSFALPDLRGRVPIHKGTGPDLSPYSQGQKDGAEQVTLLSSNIPSQTSDACDCTGHQHMTPDHTHTVGDTVTACDPETVQTTMLSQSAGGLCDLFSFCSSNVEVDVCQLQEVTFSETGPGGGDLPTSLDEADCTCDMTSEGTAHDNLPPYLAVNFVIATVGLFPSRN